MNGFQGPPAADFYSQLSGLGDTIAKNRADAAKKDAFAAAMTPGPDGKFDYGNAMLGMAQAGDPHAAAVFAQIQAHNDTIAQQAIANKRADAATAQAERHFQANYALSKRTADRADDPTPDNFVKDETAPGGYRPIGPATPEYKGSVAASVAKAEAAATPNTFSTTPIYGVDDAGKPVIMQAGRDGKMVRSQMPEGVSMSTSSPESLATRATRYLDTGDPELINRRSFGAGQQGQAQFDALQNEVERQRQARGMRPDEISSNKMDYKAATAGASAGARTKAVRETNLDLILRAADAAIPAALQANKELPRTDYVPLNRLIQKGQVMTSDPRLVKFGMSNLQLAEHWARAMNPTGVMRESDRDKALHFLDTAYGNDTYGQAVGQLRTQIEREKNAVKGGDTGYDHTRINGGRPIKVASPQEASMYPAGTPIIMPDGSPGVVP